jgi:hypothetical protein
MQGERDPSLLHTLDRVLRGTFLHDESLARGQIDVPVRRLVGLGLLLGAIYGVALGCFAAFRGADQAVLQIMASAAKVPLLFLLTLVVTFPSLYVFAALQRLPLDVHSTMRLLLIAILVNLAVVASLGPVFAFFAASTKSYAFMILLNVAFFGLGGVLGFLVLRRATRAMFAPMSGASALPVPPPVDAAGAGVPPALPPSRTAANAAHDQARRVLRTWCLVYGAVGAQMGWLLRPFLGSPDLPFTLFRPREDNFFLGVVRALRQLFQG